MIPQAVPNLCGKEKEYLSDCIDSTFVSTVGPYVQRFEKHVCDAVKAEYGFATASGTSALHLGLLAVGVKSDDYVILPSFTFIASANAIKYCNAEPWLMDVDERSWTIDNKKLAHELETHTIVKNGFAFHKKTGRRVSAIMPVYTMGMPPDIDEVLAIANKYNIKVVFDAAAAIGSRYRKKPIGSFGDATCFSFNGNKTITTGGGGAIVSNNKDVIDLARHLGTTARRGPNYDHDYVGYNYRMTNLEAAVGCAQIENLNFFINKKNEINNYYKDNLSDYKKISFFPDNTWRDEVYWLSGILLEGYSNDEIKNIYSYLLSSDIQVREFWKPIHMQSPYVDSEKGELNVTESLWNKILILPSSTNIKEEELEYVTKKLRDVL